MKSFKILIASLVLFFALIIISCGQSTSQSRDHDHDHNGDHEHQQAMEINHGEGTAFNSKYVCPMHCAGSGSETTGKCPVCGMEYVLLEEHVKDGHTH